MTKQLVQSIILEDVIDYTLAVAYERAIPDIRDGLKPVQRRLLYNMLHNEKLYPDKPHMKSANIVGRTMGEYHPHGDQALYGALVRMAQDFSVRTTLVDGQGNFGSPDGDSAAAMRYTECRLSGDAFTLLAPLSAYSGAHMATYDGRRTEPEFLPSVLPMLLLNGQTGIAVGVTTNILPHSPGDIKKAAIASILGRKIEDLAPDFPEGGILVSEGLETYNAGLPTTLTVLANIEERPNGFAITSPTPGVAKTQLVRSLVKYAKEAAPWIVDVVDHSTEKMELLVSTRGVSFAFARASVYKHTKAKQTITTRHTILSSEGLKEDVSLAEMLEKWAETRLGVEQQLLKEELDKTKEKTAALAALSLAFTRIDAVTESIKNAETMPDAMEAVVKLLPVTPEQAKDIANTSLFVLANAKKEAARQGELQALRKKSTELENLLSHEQKLREKVANSIEALEISNDEHRTKRIQTEELQALMHLPDEKPKPDGSAGGFLWIGRDGTFKHFKTRPEKDEGFVVACVGGRVLVLTSCGKAITIDENKFRKARKQTSRSLGWLDPLSEIVYASTYDANEIVFGVSSEGFVAVRQAPKATNRKKGTPCFTISDGHRLIAAGAVEEGKTLTLESATRKANISAKEFAPKKGVTRGIRGMKLPAGETLVEATLTDNAPDTTRGNAGVKK